MTTRALLVSAAVTGAFCVALAAVVGVLTLSLPLAGVLALSFVSGAGGRIFAHFLCERGR